MPLSGTPSAIREVVEALRTYIDTNVTEFEKVYGNWPSANQKLVYPALTIFAKEPRFVPLMHYVIAKTSAQPADVEKTVTRVVGQYEFALQLDLWTAYKPQRDSVYEALFAAFSANNDTHGLSLQLTGYFNQYCHYSIDTVSYADEAIAAEANEWRVMIRVLATVNAVTQKLANTMQTIENTLETPAEIEVVASSDPALSI